tara:strand:+ start:593 stop:754 length:162 start_codon:yes stop_codon:yes gene_type:complete
MKYKIEERNGRYAVIDGNNEVAGVFKTEALATKVAADMAPAVKPAKKEKKSKK